MAAMQELLRDLELELHQPGIRKSERVAELLAEDFLEFGSSGRVYDKEQVLAALQAESPFRAMASEFKIRLLSPQIALVTYRAHRHDEPPVHTLRSSIWEQRDGRWQMIFHQGTPTVAPHASAAILSS